MGAKVSGVFQSTVHPCLLRWKRAKLLAGWTQPDIATSDEDA